MRTAAEEYYGGSLDLADPGFSVRQLPVPYGPGGARFIRVFALTGTNRTLRLPAASYLVTGAGLVPGGIPQYVICNLGIGNVLVYDYGFSTTPMTIPPGYAARLFLLSAIGNPFGTWSYELTPSVESTTTYPIDAEFFDIRIGALQNFNLLNYLGRNTTFTNTKPTFVNITVYDWIGGAQASAEAAFDTGDLPSGSAVFIRVLANAGIAGAGGHGGDGAIVVPGDSSGSNPGSLVSAPSVPGNGKTALKLRCNARILNEGIIGGGGGGGAGQIHYYVASGPSSHYAYGGGGGGGGAGLTPGSPGYGGAIQGANGLPGHTMVGGNGGPGVVLNTAGGSSSGPGPTLGYPGGNLGEYGYPQTPDATTWPPGTISGSLLLPPGVRYGGDRGNSILLKTGKTLTGLGPGGSLGTLYGPQGTF